MMGVKIGRRVTIWLSTVVLVLLMFGLAGHAQTLGINFVENHAPHIISRSDVQRIQSMLEDVLLRDGKTEVHVVIIDRRNVDSDGGLVPYSHYREQVIHRLGPEHVYQRYIYVVVWSVEESEIYISIPDDIKGEISQPLIAHIVDTEFRHPTGEAKVPIEEAFFNTLWHLSGYLSLATSVSKEYNQSLVPGGIPYPYFESYNVVSSQPALSTIPSIVQDAPMQEPEPVFVPPTPQTDKMQTNRRILGMVLLGIIGIVVVILIIRRRRLHEDSSYDLDDFPEDDEDLDSPSYED